MKLTGEPCEEKEEESVDVELRLWIKSHQSLTLILNLRMLSHSLILLTLTFSQYWLILKGRLHRRPLQLSLLLNRRPLRRRLLGLEGFLECLLFF